MKPIDALFRPAHATMAPGDEQDILVELDVAAPVRESAAERRRFNVCLCLDRSASMTGSKLRRAQAAAREVVNQLREGDLLSIVAFDHRARLLLRPSGIENAEVARAVIDTLTPGRGTALSPGWELAVEQVDRARRGDCLQRVILLSDGCSNIGLRDPAALATRAQELRLKGISTSTVGLGMAFDEQLLLGMAVAGGGNYHYADSHSDLDALFAGEWSGLRSLCAGEVSLGLRVEGGEIVDLLGDLPVDGDRLRLGSLHRAQQLRVLFRVSAHVDRAEPVVLLGELCWRTLDDSPRALSFHRKIALRDRRHADADADPAVLLERALLEAARYKDIAAGAADDGDVELLDEALRRAREKLRAAPRHPRLLVEENALGALEHEAKARRLRAVAKLARFQSYETSWSRMDVPVIDEG